MSQKIKKPLLYSLIKKTVTLFYKKRAFEGLANIPEEPSIIVGNHSKTHGPIMSELYFPKKKYIWCIGQMMNMKEAPDYAFDDFWSKKPKWNRWIYRILSYLIAPIAAYIFNNADCIPVYKDMRLAKTYINTVRGLEEGRRIIIFPECHNPFNNIINDFQDRFVDVAKLYHKRTGKNLAFVPMYHAVKLKKVVFGKPVFYDPDVPIEEQRKLIINYLQTNITSLAKGLPKHFVVPYENVKKRSYVTNLTEN